MDKSALYDQIFEKVDNIMKEHNPFDDIDGFCTRGRLGYRNFCCSGCKHLSSDGCKANKPLLCRLWVCSTVWKTLDEEVRNAIGLLLGESLENDLLGFKMSKEEVLTEKDKKYSSIDFSIKFGIDIYE